MNKIKEEELTKIQDQQQQLNNIIREVGILETQKHGLLHQFGKVNEEVMKTKNELENIYGAIEINVEDGSYKEIKPEVAEVENV